MDAFQVIVIILSAALFVFLVLAIVLMIQLIKISIKIKRVTEAVDDAARSVQSMASSIKQIVTPAVIGKAITGFVQKFWNNKSKAKEDQDE